MNPTPSLSDSVFDLKQFELSVPCQAACPVQTDVPGYIEALIREDYAEAYRINRMDNVLPGVLGRVCHRPCEPACRHGHHGDSIRICHLKRTASDFGFEETDAKAEPIGKRVAIIGSGPAGLTAANDLALRGYQVDVFEQWDRLGGMLRRGIPAFRLPRDVVDRDIQSIADLGVAFHPGIRIASPEEIADLQHRFDAVLFAAGCMVPTTMDLPGMGAGGSHFGLDFVMASARDQLRATPRKAVVIGGGYTAVDCARLCFRLGAEAVTVAYRRTEAMMRVGPQELEALAAEGIATRFLTSPLRIETEDGHVTGVRMVHNVLDDHGLAQPLAGSEYTIEADTVILAIGQNQELELQPSGSAPAPVIPAGDFKNGSGTVVEACADGRAAARTVHERLTGTAFTAAIEITPVPLDTMPRDLSADRKPGQSMPMLEVDQRRTALDEVELGLEKPAAAAEARRCYLCNYQFFIDPDACIYCLKCIEAMPVDCIHLTREFRVNDDGTVSYQRSPSLLSKDPGIVIDQSACIRCGECIRACPVDCISLTHRRRTIQAIPSTVR